jgi:hypothetical protein
VETQGRLAVEQTKGHFQLAKASLEAGSAAAHAVMGHKAEMFKATLQHFAQAASQMADMFQESELAAGPNAGPQGIHPTAIPLPMAQQGANPPGAY